MGESGSRLITICNACTANGRDVKARQRAMPYLLPPVRQMRSAAEQCSGEVTIRAASSRSPRPQSAVLSCWSGKARQGRVASRSIAFGTDRSLRHRVSSDPISQPQTKSPSSTLARPAGIVLSLSLSLPLSSSLFPPCPVLSTFLSLHALTTTQYHPLLHHNDHYCSNRSQRAHSRQSHIRSPAHRSSGGLTAHRTA
jgi:hypothetical protein